MSRARKNGVYTPHLILVDEINRKIYMEFIANSVSVKKLVRSLPDYSHPTMKELIKRLASVIAKMHNADIIHGDLTTSNFLAKATNETFESEDKVLEDIKSKGFVLYAIDFGLSYMSRLAEDKAVDIYVLKRAFTSTHPGAESSFEELIEEYEKEAKNADKIIERYRKVEARGRKRLAFG
eukprot:TRINITY_DN3383_c0_g1_i25.p1 TRINITY_DN3383_c0_g1~~TRINITY_DN3383_c0_g1_i25.p1  ORF type:complete len:180 (-),score=52.32 TRINITY_DN3383_c0_g1_i25:135-674(-)